MTNQKEKCSARLYPRAREEWHDLKRSHYNCICNLVDGIATPPDTQFNQGRTRDDKSESDARLSVGG